MGICMDLAFFLVWFNCPCAVTTDFGKYLSTNLDVNPGHDWNNPLSMSSIHVEGTGLNAAACRYCISSGIDDVWCALFLCYSCGGVGNALGWEVSGIYIIHFFCLLVLGWLFCCCILLWLAVLWTHLCIQNHISFQLRQMNCVCGWIRCVPHMLHQVRMGNWVKRVYLVTWFGHLGIPHEWVAPYLLIGDVAHQIWYNVLWLLYRSHQFLLYFMGSYEWYY